MSIEQSGEYLYERSRLLKEGVLTKGQRPALGQSVMQEEDDWLDWKVAKEMLERWGETWTKSS